MANVVAFCLGFVALGLFALWLLMNLAGLKMRAKLNKHGYWKVQYRLLWVWHDPGLHGYDSEAEAVEFINHCKSNWGRDVK